jgi:hypothetical protein
VADTTVELASLVGLHKLSGVDMESGSVEQYQGHFKDCQMFRFRLDGIVYCAIEDPSDGYRSMMSSLVVQKANPIKNTFEPIKVLGVLRTKGTYSGTDDVLELRLLPNGNVILEVGTENTDDYYPSFVGRWMPENTEATDARHNGHSGVVA